MKIEVGKVYWCGYLKVEIICRAPSDSDFYIGYCSSDRMAGIWSKSGEADPDNTASGMLLDLKEIEEEKEKNHHKKLQDIIDEVVRQHDKNIEKRLEAIEKRFERFDFQVNSYCSDPFLKRQREKERGSTAEWLERMNIFLMELYEEPNPKKD